MNDKTHDLRRLLWDQYFPLSYSLSIPSISESRGTVWANLVNPMYGFSYACNIALRCHFNDNSHMEDT